MTRENKQLLLRDLCARVPYHPKGHVVNACNGTECDEWLTCATVPMFTSITNNCQLYLRLLSSMTEEENVYYNTVFPRLKYWEKVDWFNTNHFDYRGLIPMGLAIEVTEENNPYK